MNPKEKPCYCCKRPFHEGDTVVSGLHAHCFCEWFCVAGSEDFQDVVARTHDASTDDWARITSSFFHGKFRKYSAKLGHRNYILKVQQPELPELPGMEYLCNQIARNLGLIVPHHFFIRFQNELDTFVSENFMQDHVGCNLVHIFRFLDKPEQFSCEGLLHVIEKETGQLADIHRLVEVTLFDALIGNHDRHGRNLGIIQSASGSRLAPFYDNPSYLALEDHMLLGAQHEPRGSISTKETYEPIMRDYVQEWLRLGFQEPICDFLEAIDMTKIHYLVSDSFISEKRKLAFLRLIQRRFGELQNAIQK